MRNHRGDINQYNIPMAPQVKRYSIEVRGGRGKGDVIMKSTIAHHTSNRIRSLTLARK